MGKTIQLTCVDDANGKTFAEAPVDSGMLPDSFRTTTTLTIGDREWRVVEAEPLTREEFEASGRVELRLRQLDAPDPREALFTVPTLCNDLPETTGPLLDGSEILLHSDDWRQVELVARADETAVDEELGFIAQVLQDARSGDAFAAVHLRRKLEKPLRHVSIPLQELREAVADARESRVVFDSSSNCVDDSFAFFLTQDLILYGQAPEGRVEVLAAALVTHDAWGPEHQALRDLATRHDLLLVDWCRCRKAAAVDESFVTTLQAAPA